VTDRFLTADACQALIKRIVALAAGGGSTTVELDSSWVGNLRWARNLILSAGDVRDNELVVSRDVRGAQGHTGINQIDDGHLVTALRRAERLVQLQHELPETELEHPFIEPFPKPAIWSDSSFNLDAESRATGMQALVEPAQKAGVYAAGYIQVSAHGRATMDGDRVWYYPYTLCQYSVTVRDREGTGSGWAGVDGNDWSKIDAAGLTAIAVDKCLRSRNPVAVEPGRYTVILEPQAVCDLVSILFTARSLDRDSNEFGNPREKHDSQYYHESQLGYHKGPGYSMIGERVFDERLTVSMDPMDPDASFPPFLRWQVAHPVTWVKDGVLKELAYYRTYAVRKLGLDTGGLPTWGSFRMSGRGDATSVDEMIATTKRGILVTRLAGLAPWATNDLLLTGYTRDGTWLIENGKVSKPVKNFRFAEAPLTVLNRIEQIGVPKRVFRPNAPGAIPDGYAPVVVPALKVRDFNFVSLADAV